MAESVDREVSKPRDFAAARRFVELLKEKGELGEADIVKFAEADRYAEPVVALSLLCSTFTDLLKPLMQSRRNEGLLVPCRAADLKWKMVSAILRMRFSPALTPQRARTASRLGEKESSIGYLLSVATMPGCGN
jgi:hypothetical protein